MKYIIGLGNPGGEYDGTKHNIGFAVAREIASEYGIDIDKERGILYVHLIHVRKGFDSSRDKLAVVGKFERILKRIFD